MLNPLLKNIVILALAESAMAWDLFIYKATLLAEVDLQYTLSYCTVISALISFYSPVRMIVLIKCNFYMQQ